VIRWGVDGPYEVVFSTRAGGVSEGEFASLNLGMLTGDAAALVEENRSRLCAEVGVEPVRLALNRQVHGARLRRALAGERGEPGDALWTDEPGVPMLKLTADCLPIAIARTEGARALAVLHAGRRGLSHGIVAAGVALLGEGAKAAVVGPAIGPCCYEVGNGVSELFDEDLVEDRRLDLWSAAERALRAAGVERVERVDLCTSCHPELFFSHRRDGMARGAQGVVGALA
jgi:polyphenol oxidase